MNLSHLQYFRELAQVQHYTKAAHNLFISQPTLSHSIASLEDELGVKLFEKTGERSSLPIMARCSLSTSNGHLMP